MISLCLTNVTYRRHDEGIVYCVAAVYRRRLANVCKVVRVELQTVARSASNKNNFQNFVF